MKLTDTFAKRKQGNGKVQKHSDGGGLYLYISPEGKKSWRMGYRFLGKQKLLVIGPYPAISLKEARERRDAAKKLLVDNIDPSTAKKEAKATAATAFENSFENVAREWIEKKSTSWQPQTKEGLVSRLEQHIFPHIGKRPVKSVNAPELLAVLRKIEGIGSLSVAHKARNDCGRIFRYAIATGRAERDVAADLQGALSSRPTIQHFASLTDPTAIGRLLSALDTYPGTYQARAALKLAPFLFVRSGELARAEWSEFDFEAAEWRIPATKMKMKQLHIVPLSRQVLDMLDELRSFSGHGQYLFPGRTKGKAFMNSDILVNALRRLGYCKDEMTFHGFRSMASTLLNEKGYNRDWIERQLAHSERNGVRAAYNYAEYLPERRKMMQEWADYLSELKKKTVQAGRR